MSDGPNNPGVFVVAGLISERSLKERYACWVLARCGGSLAEAARAMGTSLPTVRKWTPAGVLGPRPSGARRRSVEDQAGVAAMSRQYLDRVAGRLDGGDGAFVVEGVVVYEELRGRYFLHVFEKCGRDAAGAAKRLGVSARTAARYFPVDADPVPSSGRGRGRPPGLLRPRPERERSPAKGKAPFAHQLRGRPVTPEHFCLKDRM